MKIKKYFLFIITMFFSSLFIISCGDDSENGNEENVGQAVNVEVETLKSQKFTDFINVVGTVKPIQSAKLSLSEGGVIDVYSKEKGDYVAKGEKIMELENDVLKANLEAARARYDLAQTNFKKQEAVYNDNINSEIQYLEAKSNRDQVKADFEMLQARYDNTILTAPFAGVIDDKYVEEGEMVTPGISIVNLINKNVIKIEAGVPENYVRNVKIGDSVKISFDTYLDEPVWSVVSYVGTSINQSNRTFPVEVKMANKRNLKPEMVANLFIQKGIYKDVIVISEQLATRTENGFIVFVAEDGKAKMRELEILSRFENKIAVSQGLKAGDKLIVLGQQNLVEGENIEVVN